VVPSGKSAPEAQLSIVIPTFNSAPWLPSTLASVVEALRVAKCTGEIVIVDDGSTDDTATMLDQFKVSSPFPTHILTQENQGKFHTRLNGVRAASAEFVVLMDSRVLLDPGAIAYLLEHRDADHPTQPWNGHVPTDTSAPVVGHFWTVPTYVFWGSYLGDARPTLITAENFDRVPKGTGLLAISSRFFQDACEANEPDANAHLKSDDTKILRWIASRQSIRLEPGFSATYRPRTSVRQFLSHSFLRGTLFVDSYAGTSLVRNLVLVLLAVAPWIAIAAFVLLAVSGVNWLLWATLITTLLALLAPAFVAAARRCPAKALAAYGLFVVPFGFTFAAGLLRGVVVHRSTFKRSS